LVPGSEDKNTEQQKMENPIMSRSVTSIVPDVEFKKP